MEPTVHKDGKHTYRVERPDGTIATRKTFRTYLYLVVVWSKKRPGTWADWGWSSRRDLAEKDAASARRSGLIARIIPVEQPKREV